MNIKPYLLMGVSALSVAVVSSCVDSNYDLSDIDTTARFQAKELVVPINLDTITLDQVLDLDDGSEIVKTTDGSGNIIYAFKKEGTFQSEKIEVKPFTITIPDINPTQIILNMEDLRKTAGFVKAEGALIARYDITEDNSSATSFESPQVSFDKSIKKIDQLGVTTKYINTIKVTGLSQKALANSTLTGLVIQYPKGMSIIPGQGVYNSKTGELDLSNETLKFENKDGVGVLVVEMAVDRIIVEEENVTADYETNLISYAGSIKIKRGQLNVYADTDLAETIHLDCEYKLEAIQVSSYTGKVEYRLEDFNIDPIHINDLPDILSQSGSKINLENPQIYLSLTNPLYQYNLLFQTDLSLTSMRDGKSQTYRPDNGYFVTKSTKAVNNEFVLSPEKPAYYYEGYTDPEYVQFSSLKTILSDVGGIPELIEVNADNPMMPTQQVNNFKLGNEYDGVEGQYTLYAPLQLSDNSHIVYNDTIDGWNDEDVDAITIEKLVLSFDATMDIPFEIELKVRPIDKWGKTMEGVNFTTAHLGANAKDEHVTVTMEGTIANLDGLVLEARLVNVGSDTTLAPNMTLIVKNVKATVTGMYEKEL